MEDEFDKGADDEVALPLATVKKLIQDCTSPEIICTKEYRDIVNECCTGNDLTTFILEFIHLISSEANEISEKGKKKTIGPEHIIQALQALGFEDFVSELELTMNDAKNTAKQRERKVSTLEASGLTETELLKQQEELFAKARENLSRSLSGLPVAGDEQELTETEENE
ncbi:TATA binding protein-associated phospho protein [Rozella allomycis CSF55]|uniref:TATA binding protein-associated phospho protein n=1 Tax=Rozella allomycis (strain CSF55) TaxID=988480 RepID=A0A075AQU6_ROZAC|nr:Transcriptional regulator Dr1/Ncb2 domain-containing protein [Rozella allomycis CSF55]RKP21432.1 TATA binding protein-associated phospho protein [Rozella allomycis CSF55]|eukprot:EPZ32641.1 Transcriptional regulator Dr1/Ncb2 domain-containing protein [Rozella allomycis CSF55]